MATYTAAAGGGDWNNVATWGGGGYPQAGDTAQLDATSGNVTINVASACAVVDCTGYTGTLTMDANMTTTGNVTLVSGMTFTPNTNEWYFNGGTVIPAGKTFYDVKTNNVTLSTSDIIISHDLVFDGYLKDSSRTVTMTGGTISRYDSSAYMEASLTFAGDVTVSGVLRYRYGTITYSSGSITTAGSTLNFADGATLDTDGMTWNNIQHDAGTLTLSSDLTCSGLATNGGVLTINGNDFYMQGGFTQGTGNNYTTGTGDIYLQGGTWTNNGTGAINNDLYIDGDVTVSGEVYVAGHTMTYVSGSVTTTGSTLSFGNGNYTLDTDGITWNAIDAKLMNNKTLTLSSPLQAASIDLTGAASNNVLACSTHNVTLTGNWTNPKGTTGRTGNNTFIFNGTSVLDGDTNFYNMTINAGKTVTMDADDTFAVTNIFTAEGTDENRITLQSDDAGTQVDFDVTTVGTVNYVNATDIDSSDGSEISEEMGILSNCLNWITGELGDAISAIFFGCNFQEKTMYNWYKDETSYLTLQVLDEDGAPVNGLTIGYEVFDASDGSSVESGNMANENNIYKRVVTLDTAGQYYVVFTPPEGYENSADSIVVQDHDDFKADTSTLATATNLATLQTDVTFIKNIEGGKWQIISNQMIIYASDNETEVCRFNLYDSNGDPTMTAVAERRRV